MQSSEQTIIKTAPSQHPEDPETSPIEHKTEVTIPVPSESNTVCLGKRLAPSRILVKQPASKRPKRVSVQLLQLPASQDAQEVCALTQPEQLRTQESSKPGSVEDNSSMEGDADLDDGNDTEARRERRLLQNRKSAKKCRLKKKAEFKHMIGDVDGMKHENKDLAEKINEITVMLYQKIEENTALVRKVDQLQAQNQQLLLQQQLAGIQYNQPSPLITSQPTPASPFLNPINFGGNSTTSTAASINQISGLVALQQQQQQQAQVSNLLGVLTGLLKNQTQPKSPPASTPKISTGLNPLLQTLLNKNMTLPQSGSNDGSSSAKSDKNALASRVHLILPKFRKESQSTTKI